jgi:hypothetical protein
MRFNERSVYEISVINASFKFVITSLENQNNHQTMGTLRVRINMSETCNASFLLLQYNIRANRTNNKSSIMSNS